MIRARLLPLLLLLGGCASLFGGDVPKEPPPLTDMEEPLDLFEEPDDESERRNLPLGSFTGATVTHGATSLDELDDEAAGLLVRKVIENSPADAAGIYEGDLLLEAQDASGRIVELAYPSQWRALELSAAPGSRITVLLDRAGRELRTEIEVVRRVRPPGRKPAERFREEQRIGAVLRTATEVEARNAGLGPGGGAVIVGLSRASPWRRAGLRYGDVLTRVGDRPVDHPQVVLDVVREAEPRDELDVEFVRDGESATLTAAVTRRATDITDVSIPPFFEYETERGETEWSVLMGLVGYEGTKAAWKLTLFWLFHFAGGDADVLEEVETK